MCRMTPSLVHFILLLRNMHTTMETKFLVKHHTVAHYYVYVPMACHPIRPLVVVTFPLRRSFYSTSFNSHRYLCKYTITCTCSYKAAHAYKVMCSPASHAVNQPRLQRFRVRRVTLQSVMICLLSLKEQGML